MKFTNSRFKYFYTIASVILFALLSITAIEIKSYIAALIFLVLTLIYMYFFYRVGFSVEITNEGITSTLLSKQIAFYRWDEIEEFGITPISAFKRYEKNKSKNLSFYFSKRKMSNEERLQMVVQWPPKEILYFDYSDRALAEILKYWDSDVVLFNVSKSQLFHEVSILAIDHFIEERY